MEEKSNETSINADKTKALVLAIIIALSVIGVTAIILWLALVLGSPPS